MCCRKTYQLLLGIAITLSLVQTSWGRECEANELAKLLAADGAPGDHFGHSVAVCGDTAVIGAPDNDDNGANSGSAYVFRYDGSMWIEEQTLLPCDGAAGDSFGVHVACSGDTVVVAAQGNDDSGTNSGSAYVFRYDGSAWVEDAKLLASDGAAEDLFGAGNIAISGDTVVICAMIDDNENGVDAGAAYVFQIPPDGWGGGPCSSPINEDAKLLASDGEANDKFGISGAIAGSTAMVGAKLDDSGTHPGAVYVFNEPPGGWAGTLTEDQKLSAPGGAPDDHFGSNGVAISGETAIIGAFDDDHNGTNSGSAYVFVKSSGIWVEEAKLLASDGAAWDWFGYSVAISGDTVVIGAVSDDNDSVSNAGSAYVFKKPPSGWASAPYPMNEDAKLTASDGGANDKLGVSVGISGGTVIAGAFEDDDNGSNSGSVYVFTGLSDCNTNGVLDICDIANGTSQDCNGNGIPDDCELAGNDCNTNGVLDICDIANGTSQDCNGNGIPDDCELTGNDCNTNGIPDGCEPDCDADGAIDDCDDDRDGDGVLNDVDVCPDTPSCEVLADGRPRLDMNGDCEVNGMDIQLVVQQLLAGCSACN